MCASVLLKLNIELFFGVKHIKQVKRYVIRRQMHVCNHIFFSFLNFNIILKISMPVLLFFSGSFFYHRHVKLIVFKYKL